MSRRARPVKRPVTGRQPGPLGLRTDRGPRGAHSVSNAKSLDHHPVPSACPITAPPTSPTRCSPIFTEVRPSLRLLTLRSDYMSCRSRNVPLAACSGHSAKCSPRELMATWEIWEGRSWKQGGGLRSVGPIVRRRGRIIARSSLGICSDTL